MFKMKGIRRLVIGLAIYVIVFLFLFMNAAFACGTHKISLSWQPPVVNMDGSEATDIDGFIIYYWEDGDINAGGIDIGYATSYQLEIVDSGLDYNFAVTAYDKAGNQSDYSEIVSTTTAFCEKLDGIDD